MLLKFLINLNDLSDISGVNYKISLLTSLELKCCHLYAAAFDDLVTYRYHIQLLLMHVGPGLHSVDSKCSRYL